MTRGWALAASAVLGLFVGAQSNAQLLRMDIPFAFHVRESTMPAGEYEVRVDVAKRQVFVSAVTGLAMTQFMAMPAKGQREGDASVVFHKFGNSYFLDEVRTGTLPYALASPAGKKQREAERIARADARAEVAEVRVPAARVAR
jgi:hypothetical protein